MARIGAYPKEKAPGSSSRGWLHGRMEKRMPQSIHIIAQRIKEGREPRPRGVWSCTFYSGSGLPSFSAADLTLALARPASSTSKAST